MSSGLSGLTFGLATIAFIIYEAVPILNYLLSLMGSVCFAPLCIIFPPIFWLHDFNHWRKGTFLQQLAWVMHIVVALIGAFLTVAGTYGTIRSIIDAYAQGIIGEPPFPLLLTTSRCFVVTGAKDRLQAGPSVAPTTLTHRKDRVARLIPNGRTMVLQPISCFAYFCCNGSGKRGRSLV